MLEPCLPSLASLRAIVSDVPLPLSVLVLPICFSAESHNTVPETQIIQQFGTKELLSRTPSPPHCGSLFLETPTVCQTPCHSYQPHGFQPYPDTSLWKR